MEVITKNKLPALRAGKLSDENAKKLRKLWADIRTAALKGEYAAKLDGFDFRYFCSVETKFNIIFFFSFPRSSVKYLWYDSTNATTLAKQIGQKFSAATYLNWDDIEHSQIILGNIYYIL